MVKATEYESLDERQLKELMADRKSLLAMCSSDAGLKELMNMIGGARLFDKMDGEDVSVHNFVIDILTRMGFCDERNIEKAIRFMVKNAEVLPDEVLNRLNGEKS